MHHDITLLGLRAILGEDLTAEETHALREYDLKYQIVRYVYMDKMKTDGCPMSDFHFSPGDKFMETSVYDMVKTIVDMNEELRNAKPLSFGDSKNPVHNPPTTGKEKVDLSDYSPREIKAVD